MNYDKKVTTTEQQINILKNRGLNISNDKDTVGKIDRIGYFKLKGYCLSFMKRDNGKYIDEFENNASFQDVYNLYIFDQFLHISLISLTNRIETQFKARLGNWLSQHFNNAILHKENMLFNENKCYLEFQDLINKYTDEKKGIANHDAFTSHYRNDYEKDYPIWVLLDVFSVGEVSKTYYNMEKSLKKGFSKEVYDYPYTYLQSWMHCVTFIRNLCSHNRRTINRKFAIRAKLLRKDRLSMSHSKCQLYIYFYLIGKIIEDKDYYFSVFKEIDCKIKDLNIDVEKIGLYDGWYDELVNMYN